MIADIGFLLGALAIIAFSYFMLFKRETKKLTVEELREIEEKERKEKAEKIARQKLERDAQNKRGNQNQRQNAAPVEEEIMGEDPERAMSRAYLAREAKKQAK